MSERLNKYLAFHLGISRREADSAIEHGHVSLNDKKATLGDRYETGDVVLYKKKPVVVRNEHTYLAFHKPAGYVCSRKQQGESPTIYSLLPKEYHRLKPVGRLDRDSSGLLLLTDDGDFAHHMTHPSFYKTKIYEVALDSPLEPLHQQMISDFGITLEDGPSRLTLERLDDTRRTWRVTMHEGRNRQIRRTFAALGYTVTALHRTVFGSYMLSNLKPKEFIELSVSNES